MSFQVSCQELPSLAEILTTTLEGFLLKKTEAEEEWFGGIWEHGLFNPVKRKLAETILDVVHQQHEILNQKTYTISNGVGITIPGFPFGECS